MERIREHTGGIDISGPVGPVGPVRDSSEDITDNISIRNIPEPEGENIIISECSICSSETGEYNNVIESKLLPCRDKHTGKICVNCIKILIVTKLNPTCPYCRGNIL